MMACIKTTVHACGISFVYLQIFIILFNKFSAACTEYCCYFTKTYWKPIPYYDQRHKTFVVYVKYKGTRSLITFTTINEL